MTCPNCDGTGVVETMLNYVAGTGIVREGCDECGGTGEVEDDEEVIGTHEQELRMDDVILPATGQQQSRDKT